MEKNDLLNAMSKSKDIKIVENQAAKGGKGRAGRRFFIL
jgi:hypothetical protein